MNQHLLPYLLQPKRTLTLLLLSPQLLALFIENFAPDKPVFVEVGDTVSEGSVLCVIEAMKLFNEIESEVSGKIVKILLMIQALLNLTNPYF